MGSILGNLDLVDSDLILGMGIRFWVKLVEDQNISSISHCQYVISYLQGFMDDIGSKTVKISRINPARFIASKMFRTQVKSLIQMLSQSLLLYLVSSFGRRLLKSTKPMISSIVKSSSTIFKGSSMISTRNLLLMQII